MFRITRTLFLALCCTSLLACKAELGTPDQAGNGTGGSVNHTGSPAQPGNGTDNGTGGTGNGTGGAGNGTGGAGNGTGGAGNGTGGAGNGTGGAGNGTGGTGNGSGGVGDGSSQPPQPAKPTTLDLAGTLPLTKDRGTQFDIQLCADKVCVTQSALADGSFGFMLKLSQWPQDKPLQLTARSRQQAGLSLSSPLPTLDKLLKLDQNTDGIITEQEIPQLHLSPMLQAYQSIMAALQQQDAKQDVTARLLNDPQLNHKFARELTVLLQFVFNGDLPLPAQSFSALALALVQHKQSRSELTLFEGFQRLAKQQGVALPDKSENALAIALRAMQKLDTRTPAYQLMTTFYPRHRLTLEGVFPSRLSKAKVSVEIGAIPNHEDMDKFLFKPDRPIRPLPLPIMAQGGQLQDALPIMQGHHYNLTLSLADLNNTFASCKPGQRPHADDLMQDTLTLVVRDAKSEVELRSVLGSFCELVKRDGNQDGILTVGELPRLRVGYISTAQQALLLKTTLSSQGTFWGWKAWPLTVLEQKLDALPRQQVELLAAMVALQAHGELWNQPVNLIDGVDFQQQLLAWVGINLTNQTFSSNNLLPELFTLEGAIADNGGLGPLLNHQSDKNISHVIKEAAALIRGSESDAPLYPGTSTPGSWVTIRPNSPIAPVCLQEVLSDQVIGLAILGQGVNQDGSYWVTIGWQPQEGTSQYRVGWGTASFNQMGQAQQQKATPQQRITLDNLVRFTDYQIRVMSDGGTISAPLHYRAGQSHVADTRITRSLGEDDGKRGRDLDGRCDPLSGQAVNSSQDGILGARYIKLDRQGKPLPRQDLSYKQAPFACVADALSGLVWETKVQHKDGKSSLHDDQSLFAYDDIQSDAPFNGSCYDPQSGALAGDRSLCNLKRQISLVNQSKLCGLSNWRAPSQQEFYGIMTLTNTNPISLDTRYFPLYSGLKFSGDGIKTESIIHGFWTNAMPTSRPIDTALLDVGGLDAYKVSPDKFLRGEVARQYQPHYVMLVSDGFQVKGE